MIVYVAVNCQSGSRQGKAYKLLISKGQKAEAAMAHKNKTQKYPVDTACKKDGKRCHGKRYDFSWP